VAWVVQRAGGSAPFMTAVRRRNDPSSFPGQIEPGSRAHELPPETGVRLGVVVEHERRRAQLCRSTSVVSNLRRVLRLSSSFQKRLTTRNRSGLEAWQL